MRGQHDRRRRTGRGDDVEAVIVDRLLDDVEPELAKVAGQPAAGLAFAAGRGIDVDEPARERDEIHAGTLPDPRLELRARVGARVAILHDHRRGQRQPPLGALADGHRARAGHHDRAFGNHQRLIGGRA